MTCQKSSKFEIFYSKNLLIVDCVIYKNNFCFRNALYFVQVPPPPIVVDETELMIKKMYVTLGSTPTSQTKEWFVEAKQVGISNQTAGSAVSVN